MNPKEKASELIGRVGKEYALICVEQIIDSCENIFDDFIIEPNYFGGFRNMRKYWKEVLNEVSNSI